jgi:protein-disulfide isomerase/uncharacterized membrane protein
VSRPRWLIAPYLFMLLLGFYLCLMAASGSIRSAVPMVIVSMVLTLLVAGVWKMAGILSYQWPALVLVAMTLAGLNLAGIMNSLTSDSSQEGPRLERVCRPEGQSNLCQQAFQSRWARVPIGPGSMPIIVLGVVFYSALLFWFLVMGRPAPDQRVDHLVPVLVTAAGTVVAVQLTWVMFSRLAGPCRLCMGSHAVTVLLFVTTILSWPRRGRAMAGVPGSQGACPSEPLTLQAASWHGPATTLFLVGVACLAIMQARLSGDVQRSSAQVAAVYQQIADDPEYIRWDFDRQPVEAIALGADDAVRGPNTAPFLAIAYGDFQCPKCKELADRLEEVQRAYPGRLRVAFRHFPLDRSCNPMTSSYTHAFACEAARAAEAARLIGGNQAFWKMHDAIFRNQSDLDMRPYAGLARQIGLDPGRLAAEMKGPRVNERIRAQIAGSEPFKVNSTPALFLNGHRVRQWGSMAFWKALLGPPATRPASPASTRPSSR